VLFATPDDSNEREHAIEFESDEGFVHEHWEKGWFVRKPRPRLGRSALPAVPAGPKEKRLAMSREPLKKRSNQN
jgi:hypothetical protein